MKAISTHATGRRDFLRSFAILGGALVASRGLMACVNPRSEATGQSGDALVQCAPPTISANHGHKLVVSSADVDAGVSKTYAIQGLAGHNHNVTISSAQFADLALGGSITVASTTTVGHSHNVTVTCAASHESTGDAGSDAQGDVDAASAADASSSDGGAGDGDDADNTTCPNGADASSISNNHGHTLFVSHDDVATGDSKSYSIQGSASHAHNVTISAAQFATLRSGDTISLPSTTTFGHSHTVTVICV